MKLSRIVTIAHEITYQNIPPNKNEPISQKGHDECKYPVPRGFQAPEKNK